MAASLTAKRRSGLGHGQQAGTGWVPLSCPGVARLLGENPIAECQVFHWALLLLRSVLGRVDSGLLPEVLPRCHRICCVRTWGLVSPLPKQAQKPLEPCDLP